ncbi:aminotransferase class V-fold PLP-dependent enzyme [Candidatus Uhrbacteria bacterium]|nr:aminotransferase class V-fold PLP-dependent enzyme [Candidatus Uhrbacteria bacterium]
MKSVYLDHAATTPLDSRVLAKMQPYFSDVFANPSSFHSPGLKAKEAVDAARKSIAVQLNAHSDEIIFCSGGTESDNLVVVGAIRANKAGGRHVITSSVEHHAVLEPLIHLQKMGEIELTILPVDKFGRIDAKDLEKALRPETILVSIMYANNEIGTIEPIADIGRAILKWRKANATRFPFFHSDACQAAGALDLDVEKLHVDLLTLNGSKIYGPKGVGLLFVRRGAELEPLVRGGGQERGLRSGTENVPGIIGLAAALELAQAAREKENLRLTKLRDKLIAGLLEIPKTRLNGHPTERLPNNINVSFMDIEGEAAVLYLDAQGIFCSTGSACASSTLDPSHVILAIGVSYEAAHGSLRFTLGRSTKSTDIDYVLKTIPDIVAKLRHMSPVNLDMKYFT